MEIASIIASVVSTILGGCAVWLAVHFYTEGKRTETQIQKALTKIETQSDALQKLTGRWMDRFTKYFTSPKEPDAAHLASLAAIRDLQTSVAQQLPMPKATQEYATELVTAYIALYHYTAITNVAMQAYLPPAEELEEDSVPKFVIDNSARDFAMLSSILSSVDPAMLEANSLHHLLQATTQLWTDDVKDSGTIYAKRQLEKEKDPEMD